MTLIVGLKCKGAVILAAETEEAAGFNAKREVQKLRRIVGNDWVVVIGGAGDSAICENAVRRIEKALAGHKTLDDDRLTDTIDDVLGVVHAKYIAPDPRSEGIALMIGAVCGNDLHLISTHKRTPQFHDDYAYAGIGSDLAIYFLDRVNSRNLEWKDAAKFAAFIMREVKEAAQFCSGYSQIYVLHPPPNPRWRSLGEDIVLELESMAGHFCDLGDAIKRGLEEKLFFFADPKQASPEDEVDDYQDEFRPHPKSSSGNE